VPSVTVKVLLVRRPAETQVAFAALPVLPALKIARHRVPAPCREDEIAVRFLIAVAVIVIEIRAT
jgi:hypothetical protein